MKIPWKVKIFVALMHAIIFGCSPYYSTPPNTFKECVESIYQSNCKSAIHVFESFNASLYSRHDSTPGVSWTTGKVMRAVADGRVHRIEDLNTGRLGGKMVRIFHDPPIFQSWYAHLQDELYIKLGDRVKAGDPIGKSIAHQGGRPKLMFKVSTNYENPDNWGPGHGCMTDVSSIPTDPHEKYWKQKNIIEELYWSIGIPTKEWELRTHNPGRRSGAIAYWSLVEHMRYLECIFKENPEKIGDSAKFREKADLFYKNQPIVIRFPF